MSQNGGSGWSGEGRSEGVVRVVGKGLCGRRVAPKGSQKRQQRVPETLRTMARRASRDSRRWRRSGDADVVEEQEVAYQEREEARDTT